MKCLYCDRVIDKVSIASLFLEEDSLCPECRKAMKFSPKTIEIKGMKIETFYEYDSLFKSIIIQYKECYDEALKTVFLYGIKDYIRVKYAGYKIVYVPSSHKKIQERGFMHIKEIFDELGFKEAGYLILKNELVQEGKTGKQRESMEDNYIFDGAQTKKVLVVDDIVTTGSSMKGCLKAISPYADKIRFLALARV